MLEQYEASEIGIIQSWVDGEVQVELAVRSQRTPRTVAAKC